MARSTSSSAAGGPIIAVSGALTVSRSPARRRSAACRSATVRSSVSRSSASMPGCLAEVASTGAPVSPSSSSSRLRSPSTMSVSWVDKPVGLVEHHDRDAGVRLELGQVGLVQDPVAVLLRVDHPDHLVDESEQPVHLGPVAALDRVEVGQVEQHEAAQRRLVVAVQRALPDEALPWQHADPVEQAVGRLERTPDAGVRGAGGRPAHPDRRQLEPGQRVEQAGLAAAGAAGEGHHGVVAGQREPGAGPLDQGVRGHQVAVGQVRVDQPEELGQRLQPLHQFLGVDPPVGAGQWAVHLFHETHVALPVNASSARASSTSAAARRSSAAGAASRPVASVRSV